MISHFSVTPLPPGHPTSALPALFCLYESALPPTYILLPHRSSIPLHWATEAKGLPFLCCWAMPTFLSEANITLGTFLAWRLASGRTGWSGQPMLLLQCGCNSLLQSFCQLPHQVPWVQSDCWLLASNSALVSCWSDFPSNGHTRFLSPSASWPLQQCWIWCLQTWCIPRGGCSRLALPSVSDPFFWSQFFIWTVTFLGKKKKKRKEKRKKPWDGWVAPSLDQEPCLSTGGGFHRFYLPLLCSLQLKPCSLGPGNLWLHCLGNCSGSPRRCSSSPYLIQQEAKRKKKGQGPSISFKNTVLMVKFFILGLNC
jgi:hypothetical protein